ncbi:TlpA family protein disulfide reductase [Fodinibius halophilus]|uniref:TlpA family protein disulfide reductase n=1 Tax=Fodinibius halophilus TaxID=1736908 RepID=A0A6M1T6X0_9BACT|nr:TlpA disulfide reductase family protein [Fodinibius halophilus]NGP89849.1 TlpA family protein disulfide reductase [Fodinibius halophilus]
MMNIRQLRLKYIVWIFLLSIVTSESSAQQADSKLQDITPDQLQEVVDSYQGEKAVLINVWATWCAPCIEEFPEIVKLQRNYSEELKVIFISADFPNSRDKAKEFLKEQGVDWITYFKTGKDEAFINTVSEKWTGALPFSKVIDINGNVVDSWEKKASYKKFERHIKTAINP